MHWFLCSCQADFHCITVMQLVSNSVPWEYRVGLCGYFLFFDEETKLFFSLYFLQTEEDYIPYPSVHEVGWWCAAVALFPHVCVISLVTSLSWNYLHVYTILFLNPCNFASWDRCWAEKAPFLSSYCHSLGVTGSKGLTMSWVTQWTANSCSLCHQTPAPSWDVTQQLVSTGNTS